MSKLSASKLLIKNASSCIIRARCVRTTRLEHGDGYDCFLPGHFTGDYTAAQVLPLNLSMMTGMGGPGNLEEFYLEIQGAGQPYYWTSTVCKRDDSQPHIWLKATGNVGGFGISEYTNPTSDDLELAGLL